jgi:CubicO group peptidase (beta-lactamase class C family)
MKQTIFLISIFSFLCIGCQQNAAYKYTYESPENINDGFETGYLNEVNINPAMIERAVERIQQGRYEEVHAIIIVRENKLVFEEYFKGHKFRYDTTLHHGQLVTWDRTKLHRVMSVTKSITSACIGIAVDKGFIESVHQSIFDYLPQHQHLNKEGKDKITIKHLLTMTTGLDWNEWRLPYSHPQNDVIMMYTVADPVTFYLNKQLIDEPGTNFMYAGGSNIILGEILRHATQMNLDQFSGKYLFEPLGISPYHWIQYKNGMIDAAGSLHITPRDMAKIGVTFLNKGVWNGKRIISENWIDKSSTPNPGNLWLNNWDDHWGMRGYGYMWWTHTFVLSGERINMYYAGGWGGQFIMVIPDLNTVAVFTGGNYLAYRPPFEILKKYIIPAFN